MKHCEYCGHQAQLVTGEFIYPHRVDLYDKNFWFCDNGHEAAYVGCHGQSTKPLGRLATAELRKWKSRAHSAFDPLWKYRRQTSRGQAYNWLSQKMGIPKSECHIGMFDIDQCRRVIDICAQGWPRK